VLSRSSDGALRLRRLPGPVESHPEYGTRRAPTAG
jgi:hypothetical protein